MLRLLVGVKVVVTTKDSKEVISTMTDVEGKFKLNIKYNPDYLIEFSYIPYKQQTYRLKNFLQQYFEEQTDK